VVSVDSENRSLFDNHRLSELVKQKRLYRDVFGRTHCLLKLIRLLITLFSFFILF
jgi:hypothetical protein